MTQDLIRLADVIATHTAKIIRERGLVPLPEDAYHVCDLFFQQLEARKLLPDDLHVQSRYFAKFLVLIEDTMTEARP